MHKKVTELTNRGKGRTGNACITKTNGEMLFEGASRLANILMIRGNILKCDKLEGPEILVKEIENAIKSIKTGKAPGDDGVTSEMMQSLEQLGVIRVAEECNKI